LEITLKNKCCLYVIITIRLFQITICNLIIDFPLYKEGLDIGWLTSIGHGGQVLVTPKDSLQN